MSKSPNLTQSELDLLKSCLRQQISQIRFYEYCFSFYAGSYISETVCLQLECLNKKQLIEFFPYKLSSDEFYSDCRLAVRQTDKWPDSNGESDLEASLDFSRRIELDRDFVLNGVRVFEQIGGEPNRSWDAKRGEKLHNVTGDQILIFDSTDGRCFCIGSDSPGCDDGLGGEVLTWVGHLNPANAANFQERLLITSGA